MTELERTVAEVCGFLERIRVPYMVIGGLAALFWGEPRITRDIDVTIGIGIDQVPVLVRDLPDGFRPAVDNPAEFARETHVVPLVSPAGIRIDLVLAGLPYEHAAIERAVPVPIAGREVRVCSPEDLVIHKVISDRAKDREDVRAIIRRQQHRFDRRYADPIVLELSQVLGRPDVWEFYETCFRKNQG